MSLLYILHSTKKTSSEFSRTSEAFASEVLENLEEAFIRSRSSYEIYTYCHKNCSF